MKWTGAFGYLPINHGAQLAKISNHMQRVVFDNNLDGEKVRIRFSNLCSAEPLTIESAAIATKKDGKSMNSAQITKDGKKRIHLEAGEEVFSDEIVLPVRHGEQIEVFVYIKQEQSIGSVCSILSKSGAQVFNEWPEGEDGQVFYGFSLIQVMTEDYEKTVAAFGDSITHNSKMTNALYKRLLAMDSPRASLINCGISGNRLLRDAEPCTYPDSEYLFGEAGIHRFERDVFASGPVDSVLVLIGINDIMHPKVFELPEKEPTAEMMIEGYKTLAEIAHKKGARVFIGTLPPCEDGAFPPPWMEAFESLRGSVNGWIRGQENYDGWIDFDRALRSETRNNFMKPEYHDGDGLHPNEAGGAAMAEAVNLEAVLA